MNDMSNSGYCRLIGGNLSSWNSKTHFIVARSSTSSFELFQLKHLLQELKFCNSVLWNLCVIISQHCIFIQIQIFVRGQNT